MAKKKTKKKKPAKKKRKISKKKTAKKKPGKKGKSGPAVLDPCRGLHAKKLEILAEVPFMPCTLIDKGHNGLLFAHTRAEEVYQVYRQKCQERGLTIRRIRGNTTDAKYPDRYTDANGTLIIREAPCVRFEGVWEIRDAATGQTERFGGSGDGENQIWSNNSAQTIAKKQALLDYFETAWPQPTDMAKAVKKVLGEVKPEHFVESMKQMIPDKAWEVLDSTGAVKALLDFFS